jgi:dTMP kinase
VIKPALKKDLWVLCDRFSDATYAYQGGGRGLKTDQIQLLEKLVLGDFHPNMTILLDAPLEIGLQRANSRALSDRFEQEKLDFFERVRNAYLARATASPNRYQIIDASQSLADVQQDILRVLEQLLHSLVK